MFALLVVGGCERTSRRTPDDTLVVLIDGRLRQIDPRFVSTNNDVKVSRLIIPGLTTIDVPSLEPTPALAESLVPVSERVWDVTLRPGLRFSDGSPVTAEDVAYTYMSMMDPEVNSPFRGSFAERIDRVEVLDELRARFYLQKPVATLLSDLDLGIISARAARESGTILGAGSYRVASFDAEGSLLLERNPYYAGAPPPMPRIEIRTVLDANARAVLLVGGAADLAQNGVRPDLVESVAGRARVKVASGPGVVLSYLMMHNEDPALRDVRVRRAIAHAIDRRRIVDLKLAGRAVLASGMIPETHWAYEGDVVRYDYDPARAMALLDEAGFPDPDGPEPRLRLSYKTSADQFRLAIARIIASQLDEVGLEVTVRSFEFGTFFSDVKQGNYQLATMQTGPITEPDYLYTYFHSERIPTDEHPHTHNRWRYRNARIDELTMAGRSTLDRDQRLALYAEAQTILARDLPILPLWHEDNVAVLHVDVEDYDILPSARFGGLPRVSKRHR